MSSPRLIHDVPRWLDADSDASAELRAMLRAEAALPDDGERIGRLRTRLEPWIAAQPGVDLPDVGSPPTPPPASPIASAASSGLVGKVTLLLVGAGIAVSGAVVSSRSPQTASTHAAPPRVSVSAPFPAVTAAPSSSVVVEAPMTAAPSVSVKPRSARKVDVDSLSQQAALLAEARAAIDSAPTEALRLLAEHARRFPNSTLSEERSFFEIRALARAGRRSEARLALERLEQSAPASPHLAPARRLLAGAARAP